MAVACKTIFLLLMLFFSPSFANSLTPTFNTPEDICNATPYPIFCKSCLPYIPGTIYDYCKISLSKSLLNAQQFLSRIEYYLSLPSTSYQSTIYALQDCQQLAQLNIDYLSYTLESVKSSYTLQSLLANELHTLLSGTLTNQETCIDGLKATPSASSIIDAILAPSSNGTMHYSVSLALFAQGWIQYYTKKGRYLTERKHVFSNLKHGGSSKGLPLRMSSNYRQLYESISGRKLLQAPSCGSVSVSQMVVVNKNGSGNYTTISDAVAAAPNDTASSANGYFVIYVVAGVYNEYVSIPSNKKYLMMIGDGINRTVITGNRSVVDGWTTFNSATFAVVGKGFVAVNITFQNTAGAIKHQALAVRNGADMSTFYSCGFEGYQDTLCTHSLMQFYRDCQIYGTIDYIFGNAAVVFQECKIFSRLPSQNQFNTITAQGRTDPNQNTGISIQCCDIVADDSLAFSNGTIKTYLGRPWKNYSTTVFMQSYLDSLIDPTGWAEWSDDFALSTLYYAEFNNTGPGANTTNRVTWPGYHVINATEAYNFTVSNLTRGNSWLPATAVPFITGLY